jgi:hypothetical protein
MEFLVIIAYAGILSLVAPFVLPRPAASYFGTKILDERRTSAEEAELEAIRLGR